MALTLPPARRIKGSTIYLLIFLVVILLITNTYLIRRNSGIIEQNIKLQKEAEQIKVNTLDIIRTIHQVDMGLRGYALIYSPEQYSVTQEAFARKDDIFHSIEKSLLRQGFPIQQFYSMRDSINAYYQEVDYLLHLAQLKKNAEFIQLFSQNNGYRAWMAYRHFSVRVNDFEDAIASHARLKYEQALKDSFFLQLLLFLISAPTLAFTAYYANRSLSLSELLRKTEKEKNKMLEEQNIMLEKMVAQRTSEVIKQNEHISSQSKEITLRNESLYAQKKEIEKQSQALNERNIRLEEAKRIIEEQNLLIRHKNEELSLEVDRQTQNLKRTNAELVEHNNRLEQFTYIISHNLRAPMARLVGLASILDYSKSQEERVAIEQLMVKSTTELDYVIRDLSQILGIQRLSAKVFSWIVLEDIMAKVMAILKEEIDHTQCTICCDFQTKNISSLPQYIESIFYNLISNAIKYRNPHLTPQIHINSFEVSNETHIHFKDNGLGIDLAKNKAQLFNLYKRFHFHVEGKGLGLYLVKTQIEALGGQIEVESRINEGTTFKVIFKTADHQT